MKALNLSVQERDIFSDDDGSSSCIERFLKFSGEYDGAICVNDKVGVELIVSAGIAGVKIPYDLFVLGSGDFQISRASKPSLSTSTLVSINWACLLWIFTMCYAKMRILTGCRLPYHVKYWLEKAQPTFPTVPRIKTISLA